MAVLGCQPPLRCCGTGGSIARTVPQASRMRAGVRSSQVRAQQAPEVCPVSRPRWIYAFLPHFRAWTYWFKVGVSLAGLEPDARPGEQSPEAHALLSGTLCLMWASSAAPAQGPALGLLASTGGGSTAVWGAGRGRSEDQAQWPPPVAVATGGAFAPRHPHFRWAFAHRSARPQVYVAFHLFANFKAKRE